MDIQVSIKKGSYRGEPVTGTFKLLAAYKEGSRGGYVTIENPNPKQGHPPGQRVVVKPEDFELLDANGEKLADHIVLDSAPGQKLKVKADFEAAFTSNETDEEAIARIKKTFSMVDRITSAASQGLVRGLIISGPAGCGKSYGVEKQLQTVNMFNTLRHVDPNYEFVTGGVSPVGLYQKLHSNKDKEKVLVFDDCDNIFKHEESISLFKSAMNSADKRTISWVKESRVLRTADIPEQFEFEGNIIFLTNIDFDRTAQGDSQLADHMKAIVSRCHYLDLEIGSLRDQLLLVKLRISEGMLDAYDFVEEQKEEILQYMITNGEYLREVSLRMCKKISDWVKMDPVGWKELAEATCLHRMAKFQRLSRAKEAAREGIIIHAI